MSLILTHSPPEWSGTFHVVLTALVDDLLSDGQPPNDPQDGYFNARITWEDDHGKTVITEGRVMKRTDEGELILFQEPAESAIRIDVISGLEVL